MKNSLAKLRDIVIIAVLIFAAAALVPRAASTLDAANATLTEAQELVQDAAATVDTFSRDAEESLDKIDSIDIDGLNDAVGDLQDSAENLKNATSVFGK